MSCRRFFLYLLMLFLTNQASIMGFRAVAAVCRAVVVTNMVAFLYVGGVMLFNGFIIQQSAALSCFCGDTTRLEASSRTGAGCRNSSKTDSQCNTAHDG